MRISVAWALVISGFAACDAARLPQTPSVDALVWQDEFDGSGLPDAARWNYEEGLIRNNERQFAEDGGAAASP